MEYLHSIGEGQANNPRIEGTSSQNTEEGGKEYDQVSKHLEAN